MRCLYVQSLTGDGLIPFEFVCAAHRLSTDCSQAGASMWRDMAVLWILVLVALAIHLDAPCVWPSRSFLPAYMYLCKCMPDAVAMGDKAFRPFDDAHVSLGTAKDVIRRCLTDKPELVAIIKQVNIVCNSWHGTCILMCSMSGRFDAGVVLLVQLRVQGFANVDALLDECSVPFSPAEYQANKALLLEVVDLEAQSDVCKRVLTCTDVEFEWRAVLMLPPNPQQQQEYRVVPIIDVAHSSSEQQRAAAESLLSMGPA